MLRATSPQINNPLEAANLKALCELTGPCITVLLPNYRPGAASAPEAVSLKQLIRTAAELPAIRRMGQEAAALLTPLSDLAAAEELESGGVGFALFSAPGFTAGFRNGLQAGSKLSVGKHAFVRPLLAEAYAPSDVFALGVSRKHLRLFRCRHSMAEELELPAGVPRNITEAVDSDQPDHDLANRSASGTSTGSAFAVRFGTGSDREAAPEYLHHFFALIDRGLHPLVKNAPVFPMGVAEEIAAFRKAARHLNLLEDYAAGSAEMFTAEETARKAREAALAEYRRRGEAVMAEFREMPDRGRTSSMLSQVLTAAEQGRIHQVILAEEAEIPAAHRKQLIEGEDVLNAIAVETIRNGGDVFTLPAQAMDDVTPVAAILRY
ncbi:MAG: hypothetical protein JO062_22800 [Bryobacterales bacterium]|nr:hypothetical protein [Bryobacterales bacterium]